MAVKKDPVADALDNATTIPSGRHGRVIQLFGDRPEVLASIKKARVERKLSFRQISKTLTSATGETVSRSAVENYLLKEGIS